MYQDVHNMFWTDEAMSGKTAAGSPYESSSIDLANLRVGGVLAGGDPGKGEIVPIQFDILAAITGTSSTVAFALVEADNALLTTNPVVIATTGAVAEALLIPGYVPAPLTVIPWGIITKRYIGLTATVAVADLDGGVVTSGLVWDRQTNDSDNAAETGF